MVQKPPWSDGRGVEPDPGSKLRWAVAEMRARLMYRRRKIVILGIMHYWFDPFKPGTFIDVSW